MSRKTLDSGLQELQAQISHVGLYIKTYLNTILSAMRTGDCDALKIIVDADCTTSCVEIEQQALRLLILQQPLAGLDLRLLTASLHIGDYLGRISDTLVQIAQRFLLTTHLFHQTVSPGAYAIDEIGMQAFRDDMMILYGLHSLGKEIEHLLTTTMKAFAYRDVAMARTIEKENLVELRYAPICEDIMKMQVSAIPKDITFLHRITSLLWIAHKLAETSTDLVHICRLVVFIVEG